MANRLIKRKLLDNVDDKNVNKKHMLCSNNNTSDTSDNKQCLLASEARLLSLSSTLLCSTMLSSSQLTQASQTSTRSSSHVSSTQNQQPLPFHPYVIISLDCCRDINGNTILVFTGSSLKQKGVVELVGVLSHIERKLVQNPFTLDIPLMLCESIDYSSVDHVLIIGDRVYRGTNSLDLLLFDYFRGTIYRITNGSVRLFAGTLDKFSIDHHMDFHMANGPAKSMTFAPMVSFIYSAIRNCVYFATSTSEAHGIKSSHIYHINMNTASAITTRIAVDSKLDNLPVLDPPDANLGYIKCITFNSCDAIVPDSIIYIASHDSVMRYWISRLHVALKARDLMKYYFMPHLFTHYKGCLILDVWLIVMEYCASETRIVRANDILGPFLGLTRMLETPSGHIIYLANRSTAQIFLYDPHTGDDKFERLHILEAASFEMTLDIQNQKLYYVLDRPDDDGNSAMRIGCVFLPSKLFVPRPNPLVL